MHSPSKHFYEFGPYELDASERVLLREGHAVHLTPKEFETLLALVRGAGRVMSKEELLKEIWPDTFVGEATLAQNVFTLRKALGEAEGGRPYIETVPRRGYRFAVKVGVRVEGEAQPGGLEGEAGAAGGTEARALAGGRTVDEGRAVVNQHAAGGAALEGELTPAAASDEGLNASRTSPQETRTDESGNGHVPAVLSPEPAAARTPAGHPVRAAVLIAAALFVSIAALVYAVFRFSVRPEVNGARDPAPAFQSMKVTRLPVTGAVNEAVISPDGNYVAYAANETGREGMSIWVRQVGAASNTQQIVAPAEGTFYGGLVFSPDSKHVYYGVARDPARPPELYRVPVLGGPSEKILDSFGGGGPAAFSPDGRQMAVVRGSFGREMTLVIKETAGGGERVLAARKGPESFGLPAWSPDGRRIAVAYGSAESADSGSPSLGVMTFDVAGGAESRVIAERWVGITQLAWLPDGSGLVLSAAEQELSPAQIWTLSFPAGEVRRVTNDLNTYVGASLTADGSALVTVQTDRVPNIWVAPAGDAARAQQVTTGSGKFDGYYGLSWTPDGRVVYASVASGSWDIWVMNADGTGQRQLTVGARSNYGPSVSADGRYVVFVSNRAGAFNIWRMDADGSNPLRLTSGRGENFPHVTPDGRWVVYATVGAGEASAVWKVPVEGGEPVRLTTRSASWPFVSPDGKSFVCTYGDGPFSTVKLAVIPIGGGEPVRLYDVPPSFRANTVWLPDNRGIAFLDSRTGTTNVWMQPLAGGKPVQLTDFKTDSVAAFDWSRDNRLAASRSVETTGVVLIKDFR